MLPHLPVLPRLSYIRDSGVGGAAMALASGSGSGGGGSDFSVMVIGSDFVVDAGAALLAFPANSEEWHDCVPDLDDDFSDLEELQVVHVQGADRSGRPVVRVVDKFFPGAPNPLPLFFVWFWCESLIRLQRIYNF